VCRLSPGTRGRCCASTFDVWCGVVNFSLPACAPCAVGHGGRYPPSCVAREVRFALPLIILPWIFYCVIVCCVVCAHPHVCALPKTRVSPCELHAPAARHGPCAAARARCARPACVVRCLEVKQHNVTPPPCRPKLPVYEHQLNLKLVTSTSVKSLKKPSENAPAGSASGPVFPGACQVYPSHRLHTSTVQGWGHRASPTTITRPELSASDVSAAELLAASRAAEQGRRSRRKVRRKASILPYLTLPRKKRKKERKIVLLVNYIRT
jgi:hypothetical protein